MGLTGNRIGEVPRECHSGILYSLFEKHADGEWWYHGDTFRTKEDAEQRMSQWIEWDKNRPRVIFEHTVNLRLAGGGAPLHTNDFKSFYEWGGKLVLHL